VLKARNGIPVLGAIKEGYAEVYPNGAFPDLIIKFANQFKRLGITLNGP
jgi:hypothetical protein